MTGWHEGWQSKATRGMDADSMDCADASKSDSTDEWEPPRKCAFWQA